MPARADDRPRVMHLIPTLETGGAEHLLLDLVRTTPDIDHCVVCFKTSPATHRFSGNDRPEPGSAKLYHVALDRAMPFVPSVFRLIGLTRSLAPDVVHCWMYYANLIGAVLRTTGVPVLWSNHNARPDLFVRESHVLLRSAIRLSRLLSRRVPALTIYPSNRACSDHVEFGFDGNRTRVVPNAISRDFCAGARPHPKNDIAAPSFPTGRTAIGLLGRFHPQKNIECFLSAVAACAARGRLVTAVLAGPGMEPGNIALQRAQMTHAVQDLRLLGNVADVPSLLASLHMLVVSSLSEATPIVLLEGAICRTFLISTDVGDAREIISDPRFVVPTDSPEKLADAMDLYHALTERERSAIIERNYCTVATRYTLDQYAQNMRAVYREAIIQSPRDRPVPGG